MPYNRHLHFYPPADSVVGYRWNGREYVGSPPQPGSDLRGTGPLRGWIYSWSDSAWLEPTTANQGQTFDHATQQGQRSEAELYTRLGVGVAHSFGTVVLKGLGVDEIIPGTSISKTVGGLEEQILGIAFRK